MKKLYVQSFFTIFLLLSVLASPAVHAQDAGIIEGSVIDRDTQQPIIGARIEVLGTTLGAIADMNGQFFIEGLQSGTYRLKATAVDYQPIVKSDIAVGSAQSVKLVVEMQIDAYQAGEIVVTATQLFNKAEDVKVSSNELSQEEIRRSPGSAEDVSRMVQALPGVATAADSRNDLIVRGGSPIENFIMIDGIEVPNINHFGTQGASGGPIGMINVDFLQEVTFSAGGFPVKYGDRLSSIMDIQYRDGDKNKLTGKFDLGLAGAGFIVEGPIQKGKSSYIVSARKSYLDLLLSSTGLTAVPNYTNFNLKATYELSPTHKLAVIGLGGIDRIEFKGAEDEDDPSNDHIEYDAWQSVIGLSHKWLAGKQTYVQTSLSQNNYHYGIDVDSAGTSEFSNNSLDSEVLLRSDLSHRFSPADLFELGLQLCYLRTNNDIFQNSWIDYFSVQHETLHIDKLTEAFKLGFYTQYTKTFYRRFSLTGGLRYDYFNYLNDPHAISPRASLSIDLQQNLKLNFAYGLYRQAVPLIWLIGDEANKNLKYIKATHAIAGVEYYPMEDVKVTVEVFNKNYDDYPASVANPQVSYATVGTEYGLLGMEALESASTGYARGIEFFVQKKLTQTLYGLVNYAYSQIRFKALDGVERPSSFDYRHMFTIMLGYKFSNTLELSGKWRYTSGKPYTPVDLEASTALNQLQLDFSKVNAYRFAAYHRLDIRIDKRYEFDGWNLVAFIDFENLYNRKNIDQLQWDEKKKRVDTVYQWSFLPAGGIKVEF
ncbi:TonB-dependent receptor plug [Chloroherpeton thalassium ATCC 35110]|uniref:TonB-dependent receptor plug n=1 Tax=Chloroherpeton thalassium (strain ATCC 35110 / GB-78) TaxID=517418 RepID=B3QSU0_CHLT3|nr:TonB-dependent receptor [Chloroherpeton thalassium]ACF12583.1 TonB-dependent receptor plug [Chloroherpeton thalassium ATCC 35110]